MSSSEVERTFDALNRWDLLKVKSGALVAPNVEHDYFDFAANGLLERITSDGRTIDYGYNDIGSSPVSLTYKHGASTLLSTARPMNTDYKFNLPRK